MSENKEIKEMAKVLFDYRMSYDDCVAGSEENIAKYLVTLGYRKISEDNVVLSKEEYEKGRIEREWMRQNIDEILNENNKLKEEIAKINDLNAKNIKLEQEATARDIFNALGFITYRKQGKAYIFDVKELRELAKQYGVEK